MWKVSEPYSAGRFGLLDAVGCCRADRAGGRRRSSRSLVDVAPRLARPVVGWRASSADRSRASPDSGAASSAAKRGSARRPRAAAAATLASRTAARIRRTARPYPPALVQRRCREPGLYCGTRADVAQLARASACHAEGRGFESLHPLLTKALEPGLSVFLSQPPGSSAGLPRRSPRIGSRTTPAQHVARLLQRAAEDRLQDVDGPGAHVEHLLVDAERQRRVGWPSRLRTLSGRCRVPLRVGKAG